MEFPIKDLISKCGQIRSFLFSVFRKKLWIPSKWLLTKVIIN